MKIPEWPSHGEQHASLGKSRWSVSRLIKLAETLPIQEAPIDSICVCEKYDVTMREMVQHVQAILNADLDFPIILDEDGEILDGRHRMMKAMLDGKSTIRFVRFDENPPPCKIITDDE